MPLYLCTRTDRVDYDEHHGAVIQAPGPEHAIRIAVDELIGCTSTNLSVSELSETLPNAVVLASFNAG